jgi:hypothetical protein
MDAAKTSLTALIVAGMALMATDAQACGRGAMAVPVPAYGVAATVAVPPVGISVAVLPPGYATMVVNGMPFFRFGPVWYAPYQGPTGRMFRVVPPPHRS